jgi:hypothetical protein
MESNADVWVTDVRTWDFAVYWLNNYMQACPIVTSYVT